MARSNIVCAALLISLGFSTCLETALVRNPGLMAFKNAPHPIHKPQLIPAGGGSPNRGILHLTSLQNSAEPVDVLSSTDLFNGALIAVVLAFTASFLQGRRNQNDFVLLEIQEKVNTTATSNITSPSGIGEKSKVFGSDDWKDIGRPDNYILYNQRIRQQKDPASKIYNSSSTLPTERTLVLLGLVALFVPIFSIEFFFALSRQAFCGENWMGQADWARYLCSPVAN